MEYGSASFGCMCVEDRSAWEGLSLACLKTPSLRTRRYFITHVLLLMLSRVQHAIERHKRFRLISICERLRVMRTDEDKRKKLWE